MARLAADESRMVEVRVNGMSGLRCSLNLPDASTVMEAKRAIEEAISVPAIQQRLLSSVGELKDAELVTAAGDPGQMCIELSLICRDPEQAWQALINFLKEVGHEKVLASVASVDHDPGTQEMVLKLLAEEAEELAEADKTTMQKLELSRCGLGCGLGDDGALLVAQALKAGCAPALTLLDLAHNGISVSGARSIAEALECLPGLRVLDLGSSSIGDDGAKAIAKALKAGATPALASLYLYGNSISDSGAHCLAEALLAGGAENLKLLSAGGNEVGESGKDALRKVMDKRGAGFMLQM